MPEVPRIVTTWTTLALLDAFAVGFRAVVSVEPSRAALAILWGQANVECSRDGKRCYGFNVGNLRGTSPAGLYHLLPGAYEFALPGKVPAGATLINPPKGAAVPAGQLCYLLPAKAQKFRAYESFADGATDKIELIARQWPAAINALKIAKGPEAARAYVPALVPQHGPKYFLGDASPYTLSTLSLAGECLRRLTNDAWPVPPTHDTMPSLVAPVEVPNALDFVRTLATDEEPKA
jgi:hypothetical protein